MLEEEGDAGAQAHLLRYRALPTHTDIACSTTAVGTQLFVILGQASNTRSGALIQVKEGQ